MLDAPLDQASVSAPKVRSRHAAADGLYAAGHRLLEASRPADAARIFRALLACAPYDERGWVALGTCHEKLAQNDIALELYGAGHALCVRGVRCVLARARLLAALGRYERAEEARHQARLRAQTFDDCELSALVEKEMTS